ncbi:MAG: hypothetical protein KF891_22615 [Rhizobacter sp.]|nr:hypothetical protein [Rhizobacter sp.]
MPSPTPSLMRARTRCTRSPRGVAALAAACAFTVLATPAEAQPRPEPAATRPGPAARHKPAPAPKWHGDIHRFHERDWPLWRAGRWVHGPHDGRVGWWWVVGTLWYFYPAPVYPYPNPYEPPPPWVESPPAPPTQYWYYCDEARGYYPYVPACPGGWKQVPATPAPTPPAK